MMKRKVSEMNPTSEASHRKAIKKVWTTSITREYVLSLVSSKPQRIKAVLANKGGHNRYLETHDMTVIDEIYSTYMIIFNIYNKINATYVMVLCL